MNLSLINSTSLRLITSLFLLSCVTQSCTNIESFFTDPNLQVATTGLSQNTIPIPESLSLNTPFQAQHYYEINHFNTQLYSSPDSDSPTLPLTPGSIIQVIDPSSSELIEVKIQSGLHGFIKPHTLNQESLGTTLPTLSTPSTNTNNTPPINQAPLDLPLE